MRKIVGYEKFRSKKGLDCCAVFTETELKEREGVEQKGIKTEKCMIYGADAIGVIKPDSVGKELVGFIGYQNGICVVQSPSVK